MNFFKKLLGNKESNIVGIIGDDDPNLLAVVQKCMETGKPVYGEVDEQGKLTMKTNEEEGIMISIEEAHKINDFLDTVFKFKVGDFVQPAALGEFVDDVVGVSESSWKAFSWMNFSYKDNIRYQIVERILQQCHGGVQKHYKLTGVNKDGGVDKNYFQMTEGELVKSAPFRNGDAIKPEVVKEYLERRIKTTHPDRRRVDMTEPKE